MLKKRKLRLIIRALLLLKKKRKLRLIIRALLLLKIVSSLRKLRKFCLHVLNMQRVKKSKPSMRTCQMLMVSRLKWSNIKGPLK